MNSPSLQRAKYWVAIEPCFLKHFSARLLASRIISSNRSVMTRPPLGDGYAAVLDRIGTCDPGGRHRLADPVAHRAGQAAGRHRVRARRHDILFSPGHLHPDQRGSQRAVLAVQPITTERSAFPQSAASAKNHGHLKEKSRLPSRLATTGELSLELPNIRWRPDNGLQRSTALQSSLNGRPFCKDRRYLPRHRHHCAGICLAVLERARIQDT